jgi:MOSC domain-containing protein YiiM
MTSLGRVETIYIATHSRKIQASFKKATLHAGLGILGDRWYASPQGHRGTNITLIAAEEIDRYNNTYHQTIKYDATRRNVVTRGIDLNALVGKTFTLGGATLHGVDLCEPCRVLGANLANDSIGAPEAVKAFVHRGGLRADIVSGGDIYVGDEIKLA